MKSSTLEIENLIQGFKLSCQTEGKSPKATEWYAEMLTAYILGDCYSTTTIYSICLPLVFPLSY